MQDLYSLLLRINSPKALRSNFFPLLSWYLVLCTLYLIPSCKKDAPAPDLGYGYAPINVGHWVIYQIDSTAEDDQTVGRKTYQFQIKEVIESIFTDNQGRPTIDRKSTR